MVGEASQEGRLDSLPPGALRVPLLPPEKGARRSTAEPIPGPTTKRLSAAAESGRSTLVGGSLYEKATAAGATTPRWSSTRRGRMLGKYRKVQIPEDESFYEKDYFSSGREYKVFKTAPAKLGVLICFDQWYPEPARVNRLMGAEVVFYPTAIGRVDGIEEAEGDWQEAWEAVQRGHAIANSVVVAAVNRVGREGRMSFWGGSFVCDQFGKVLASADDREQVLLATCDLELGRQVEEGWGFLRNRRPATYRKTGELGSRMSRAKSESGQERRCPSELGFSMPAEWAKHDSTWLSWPKNPLTFPPEMVSKVEEAYVEMIEALAGGSGSTSSSTTRRTEDRVRSMVSAKNVAFHRIKSADVWMRDYGPIFVKSEQRAEAGRGDQVEVQRLGEQVRRPAPGRRDRAGGREVHGP